MSRARTGSRNRKYFLFEVEDIDHGGVIDFCGTNGWFSRKPPDVLKRRKKVFSNALVCTPPELNVLSRDPKLFFDTPLEINPKVKDVVFVMHGIRDDGYWTHRIAKVIKEAAEEVERKAVGEDVGKDALESKCLVSRTPTYGYFPMGAFILPWIRRQKVEWFMDMYVDVKARYPIATMHFVGHSNGTYLAARAFRRLVLEEYISPAAS